MSRNKDRKIKVKDLIFDGLVHTDENILLEKFKKVYQCETKDKLVESVSKINEELWELGIFNNIAFGFDEKYDNILTNTTEIDLLVYVSEKKRKQISLKAEIDSTGKPSTSLQLKLANIAGKARQLHFDVNYNADSHITNSISLEAPFISNPKSRWSLSFIHDGTTFTQNNILQRSTTINPSLYFNSPFGNHLIGYALSLRHATAPNKRTPQLIRKDCGYSLKNAINHQFTRDFRDKNIFPSSGYVFRMSNELAGIIGDVKHMKNTFYLQNNYSFPHYKNINFSTVFNTGFILNFQNKPTNITDRFFIGGQNSLRGFSHNCVGDSINNHFVGGDFFITYGAYLNFPIPFSLPEFSDVFRLQAFVNSGIISSSKPGFLNKIKDLGFDSLNCSAGFGLVANIMNSMRLELNYSYPIKSQREVKKNHGISISITSDLF